MKIRLQAACLIRGVGEVPGTVVELPEAQAWPIVHMGRAEVFADAPATVETREPVVEARDPVPAKSSIVPTKIRRR